MGIESDQLVFDYLSRIGDLAHGTSMTAAERARLVGGLRTRIDRMRAEDGGAESKAAVRKILGSLGKPEEVVAAANGGAPPPSSAAAVPSQRDGGRDAYDDAGPSVPVPRAEPEMPAGSPGLGQSGAPPHLASADELGPEESDPDWWRVDPSPFGESTGGPLAVGEQVPGFTGGIELPEVLKPPPEKKDEEEKPAAPDADAPSTESTPRRTLFGRLLGARAAAGATRTAGVPRVGGIVELGAAILLAAGAVTGSLIPLAAGWLAAWWSPRLSRVEAKWAAAGMPGLVVAGAAVWLWGRTEGRWGDRIPEGGDAMSEAMEGVLPVMLRVAAVASALFLLWRSRRPAKAKE
ncbi:membrane protein [Streptomyces albiaxialis]|uniref:Membrane protein n=1 Tax=Streptomyces albiaxialis TaxID=329523 RepID=A0ABP5H3U1_9ACTN